MSAGPATASSSFAGADRRKASDAIWKKALPYVGTVAIFALIFWRIPMAKVGDALKQAPVLKFVAVFLPFSAFYWMIDSICLTWVVRRFNAPMRFRDIVPIRASMYLLALINTNLGQGGVAYYLYRKAKIPFLEALSSILFIALMEIYQLFLFSTLGVIFYHPTAPAQIEIVEILRVAYIIAWLLLFAIIGAVCDGAPQNFAARMDHQQPRGRDRRKPS